MVSHFRKPKVRDFLDNFKKAAGPLCCTHRKASIDTSNSKNILIYILNTAQVLFELHLLVLTRSASDYGTVRGIDLGRLVEA